MAISSGESSFGYYLKVLSESKVSCILSRFHVARQPMRPDLLLPRQCVPKQKARALKLTCAALHKDQARLSKQQRQHHHHNTRSCLVRSHRKARLHLLPPRSSNTPIYHNITTSAFARRISISIRTQCTPPSLNTYQLHLHSSPPPANCYRYSPPLTPSIHDELTAAD